MTNILDEETRGAAVPELTQATLATQAIIQALQERDYWQVRARLAEIVCQKASKRYQAMRGGMNLGTLPSIREADRAEFSALQSWEKMHRRTDNERRLASSAALGRNET